MVSNGTVSGRPELPAVGFGTYPLQDRECVEAILSALEVGYRLIDTAVNYGNESAVGEAVRRSTVPREEIIVTSKLPGRHHGYDEAIASVRESVRRAGLDRIDLYLIHWPNPSIDRYVEAWRALIDLRADGVVGEIGVSNFGATHLSRIIEETGELPLVNQIEMHPRFPQVQMRGLHQRLGIRTGAWSPLGKRDAPFDEQAITVPAERLGVTPAQVILRWHRQLGSVPIPKSTDPGRQRQNLAVDGFELTADEMVAITALGREDGRLFGGDPETHEEM